MSDLATFYYENFVVIEAHGFLKRFSMPVNYVTAANYYNHEPQLIKELQLAADNCKLLGLNCIDFDLKHLHCITK